MDIRETEHAWPILVPAVPPPDHARRFEQLVRVWQAETRFLSSATEIASHPAYQQIIGMGPAAIPLILTELRKQPNHWFWALQSITGVDPVLSEERGDLARMTARWLNWGAQNGY